MNKVRGFGLAEVLVSLFLASLIMAMLSQLYLNNKKQYQIIEKTLQDQMELQWVQEFLSDRIRKAGFTHCIGIERLQVIDQRIRSKQVLAMSFPNKMEDMLQINRMSEVFGKVLDTPSVVELIVSGRHLIEHSRPIIIADCQHAEIHEVSHVAALAQSLRITLKTPLVFSYHNAYLGEWMEERWLIRSNATGKNALYYQLGHTEELSALIHTLEVTRRKHTHDLIDVVLGLAENKKHHFSVAVRG